MVSWVNSKHKFIYKLIVGVKQRNNHPALTHRFDITLTFMGGKTADL